ncbi:hypothetical protein, conserved [Eimeria tenella]|uniref:Uncharacterized protein n=1 Tax=Eimeria tenella TaxID=5802 RepID=U6KR35_EIMTE|nr:hypothetical protein, conserved [Eimeria tenella]CDJ40577.1 hypothetical protein, conserved [Eimeria tenella]|eukprot:XP_013231327.1 hypothetical protein, conserved [Eimeria tenella]
MDSIRNSQHNATASPRLRRSSLRAFAAGAAASYFQLLAAFWQHFFLQIHSVSWLQLLLLSACSRTAVAAAAAEDEPTSSCRTCGSCFAAALLLQQRGWQ